MRPVLHLFVAVLLVAVGLAGCESPGGARQNHSKPVLPADARPPSAAGLSAEEITKASKLYTAKCARCHKFYDPAAYDETEWRSWMAKMSKKARLKPEQEQLLTRYLEAFRSANR